MALIHRFEDDGYEGLYDSGNRYETIDNSDIEIVQDLLRTLMKKKIDSKWCVKINNSLRVSEVKIKDITEKTVLLEFLNSSLDSTRFSLSDIEFIEEIK